MKKLLSLLALYGAATTLYAGDYDCIVHGARQFFVNGNRYVKSMQQDSLATVGNTRFFYFFPTFRSARNGSLVPGIDSNGASWMGHHAVAFQNGDWEFYNYRGDTIRIRTQAHAGDSWQLHLDSTGAAYTAQLLSEDTATIDGAPDSVKHIRVTSSGRSNNPIQHTEIVLSKAHGFLQTYDLYFFPYACDNNGAPTIRDVYFGYANQPFPTAASPSAPSFLYRQTSYRPLKADELYDIAAGDVFQYKDFNYQGNPFPQYWVDSVISVTNTSNGPVYDVEERYYYRHTATSYGYSTSRTNRIQGMDPVYQHPLRLTDSTYSPENGRCCLDVVSYDPDFYSSQLNVRAPMYGVEFYEPGAFWHDRIVNLKGFGSVYWQITEDFGTYGAYALVYARKGGITYGTLQPLSIGDEGKAPAALSLSPNPARDRVSIRLPESPKPLQVRITDYAGRTLQSFSASGSHTSADLSALPNGTYLVQVLGDACRSSQVLTVMH